MAGQPKGFGRRPLFKVWRARDHLAESSTETFGFGRNRPNRPA
jgi:hypothetical protein